MGRNHHVARIHKKARKQPLDFVVYFFTIANPLFEVPQAVTIYAAKSAENVSIFTWVFFLISDVVWITYSIRRRLIPLTIMYSIYFLVELTIVVGIMQYS